MDDVNGYKIFFKVRITWVQNCIYSNYKFVLIKYKSEMYDLLRWGESRCYFEQLCQLMMGNDYLTTVRCQVLLGSHRKTMGNVWLGQGPGTTEGPEVCSLWMGVSGQGLSFSLMDRNQSFKLIMSWHLPQRSYLQCVNTGADGREIVCNIYQFSRLCVEIIH